MKSTDRYTNGTKPIGDYSGAASVGYTSQQVIGALIVVILVFAVAWGLRHRWRETRCPSRKATVMMMNDKCYVQTDGSHWEVAR